MVSVLTAQVLRRAAEQIRKPDSNEREVLWPNGQICFVAPIESIIGFVAAGMVVFEGRYFYVSIRLEHELDLRGMRPSNDSLNR